jgi:hypothetical protein
MAMRFMVLVKADKNSEEGALPDEQTLVEMGKFNEELIKSGTMLAGEGLHSSAKGARLDLTGDKPKVIDGPFTETKELIAGFWMVQAKSLEEAIERFKHCPRGVGVLEIRQVFDASDFEPSIKTEAGRAVIDAENEFRRRANS